MPRPQETTMRRSLPLAAATAVLATLVAAPAQAAADPVNCTASNPALASRLNQHIAAALADRTSTASVAVVEEAKGVRCEVAADRRCDSASIVKLIVMGTLFRLVKDEGRYLTQTEDQRVVAMVTRSDNDSTTALWRQLGRDRVVAYLQAAGTTDTTLDPDNHWGLTQISARDQLRLLDMFTRSNAVLRDSGRAYALQLMNQVVADQRWGAPAGVPGGITVHVKNGWLGQPTHGWRVHSDGVFLGAGRDYKIVLLSHDNPDLAYGRETLERVARVVHRELAAG